MGVVHRIEKLMPRNLGTFLVDATHNSNLKHNDKYGTVVSNIQLEHQNNSRGIFQYNTSLYYNAHTCKESFYY